MNTIRNLPRLRRANPSSAIDAVTYKDVANSVCHVDGTKTPATLRKRETVHIAGNRPRYTFGSLTQMAVNFHVLRATLQLFCLLSAVTVIGRNVKNVRLTFAFTVNQLCNESTQESSLEIKAPAFRPTLFLSAN